MKIPIQANPVLRSSNGFLNLSYGIMPSGGWCSCKDGSLDRNSCTGNTKPKCDVDDCDCVQK